MDKQELLQLVRSERADWDRLVGSLEPDQMEDSGVAGVWSVKDVIPQITWFEREMVGMLRARALVSSELWQLTPDQRNEAIFEKNRHREPRDVLGEAEEVHDELLAELQHLDDADLVDPARFPGMPLDWHPWGVIAGNTSEHYRDHLQDVRAWLAEPA